MQVSAHYLIDLNGDIYELVSPEKIAWHAGESYWRGREKLNRYSIGIELVDTDGQAKYVGFAAKQISSLIELCHFLVKKYPIDQTNIVAHSDIAPARKKDPGVDFPWDVMAKEGIGVFYDADEIIKDKTVKCGLGDRNDHVFLAKKLLSAIGYKVDISDIFEKDFECVVEAFKRRFYPQDISGFLNVETFEILHNLARKCSISDN